MASYQQRIALKGHEVTINHFTDLLREVKVIRGGCNSAEVINEAIKYWKLNPGANKAQLTGMTASRNFLQPPRLFYLQMLTSAESMTRLNASLEDMRSDQAIRRAVMGYHLANPAEYQLAILILVLENLKKKPLRDTKPPLPREESWRSKTSISDVYNLKRGMSAIPTGGLKPDQSLRGPSMELQDPNRHLTSWRARMREQQLAENRKLNQAIRNSCSRTESESPTASPLVKRKYFKPSPSPVRQFEVEAWTPVHQVDIRQKKGVQNRADNLLDLITEDAGLTFRERRDRADEISQKYLSIYTPEIRPVPGFEAEMSPHERIRAGIDCDEVLPRLVLGNGATLRNKEYLKSIGITHILNAAEYRGVNVGHDFFKTESFIKGYLGLKVEDTPQTQICQHFPTVAAFIEEALTSQPQNKVYVNCVFGRSRSTTCLVAYLMLSQGWTALKSLEAIRQKRAVHINSGFLLQLVDLEQKLKNKKHKNLKLKG